MTNNFREFVFLFSKKRSKALTKKSNRFEINNEFNGIHTNFRPFSVVRNEIPNRTAIDSAVHLV